MGLRRQIAPGRKLGFYASYTGLRRLTRVDTASGYVTFTLYNDDGKIEHQDKQIKLVSWLNWKSRNAASWCKTKADAVAEMAGQKPQS